MIKLSKQALTLFIVHHTTIDHWKQQTREIEKETGEFHISNVSSIHLSSNTEWKC